MAPVIAGAALAAAATGITGTIAAGAFTMAVLGNMAVAFAVSPALGFHAKPRPVA